MVKSSQKNKKVRTYKFILPIVALFLITAIGGASYAYYKNGGSFFANSTPQAQETPQPSSSPEPSDTPTTPVTDNRYLVIEDWGVRFTIPSELEDVKIKYNKYRDGDNNETYGFTTERVQALGQQCIEQPYGAIYHLVRSKERPEAVPHGALVNQTPIGGYYYSYYSGPAGCSSLDKDGQFIGAPSKIETDERQHLRKLLESLTLS